MQRLARLARTTAIGRMPWLVPMSTNTRVVCGTQAANA
jgi:hypothetical protein